MGSRSDRSSVHDESWALERSPGAVVDRAGRLLHLAQMRLRCSVAGEEQNSAPAGEADALLFPPSSEVGPGWGPWTWSRHAVGDGGVPVGGPRHELSIRLAEAASSTGGCPGACRSRSGASRTVLVVQKRYIGYQGSRSGVCAGQSGFRWSARVWGSVGCTIFKI